MRRSKGNRGFTLIELMIVIAIIAIIAAIAIPGLLQAQRASNERNASASLKTVCTAEADFRANDRDLNRVNEFWVGDVSQLYGMDPISDTESIKLIDISMAGADTNSVGSGALGAQGSLVTVTNFTVQGYKAGYWYRTLVNDELGSSYGLASSTTTPIANAGNHYNGGKFGFMAFPDSRGTGRNVFIVNENNTIFKCGCAQKYAPTHAGTGLAAAAEPAGQPSTGGSGSFYTDYPTDTSLQTDWNKMD